MTTRSTPPALALVKDATMQDEEEDPKRLSAGTSVARELWLLSGNECAWPGCTTRLLNENDDWIGEIAHICGVKKKSARYDVDMTNEERRAYENLLILCPTHHEQVDSKNGSSIHTVADLKRIKQEHEDRFRRVLTDLAEKQDEYVDLTQSATVIPCRTLAGLVPGLGPEETAASVKTVNRLAKELSRVTLAARGLFSNVVEFQGRITILEAARRAGSTPERIYDLVSELDRFRLAYLEHGDELIPERIALWPTHNQPLLDGWSFWEDLHPYIHIRPGCTFEDVIVRLDFSLLD